MTDDNMKTYPVVPGANIQLEHLPSEAKDAAMGRYMDVFGRLEGMVHLAIGLTMEIDLMAMGSVFAVLGTKQSIDLLEAVAQEHLTKEGARRVHLLGVRLGNANRRRNHIVHGSWAMAVLITDEQVTQEWVRTYSHVDPALRKLPYNDPKVAGTYTFTVPALDTTSGHVEALCQAIGALIEDLPSLRLPPQAAQE